MKAIYLLSVWVGLLALTACSDESHESAPTTREQVLLSESLPDLPPKEGECIGWQKSLVEGRYDKLQRVSSCLREVAVSNREKATKEAKVLLGWEIGNTPGSDLLPVVNTLVQFPTGKVLEDYLIGHGLYADKNRKQEGDESEVGRDRLLTPEDYLAKYGRVHWFDVETGIFPNSHDALLSELARLSKTGLKSAKFKETPPSDYNSYEEPYTIDAELNGKKYQVKAENLGDWYDLRTVLSLINVMSIEHGYDDRFVTLTSWDQTAKVLVIDVAVLEEMLEKGLLAMQDANISMVLGKAFEQSVKASATENVNIH